MDTKTATGVEAPRRRTATPFWRDERYLQVMAQIAVVVLVVALFLFLYRNLVNALAAQGLALGFRFLRLTAGFDIGESPIPYARTSTYGRAFVVGLLNTLRVSFVGIILATMLGTIIGVARLSSNWLVARLAALYIEFLRNVPLLVLLFFLATGVFFKLPRVQDALALPGSVYLTNRGVFLPWPTAGPGWPLYRWGMLAALAVALVVAFVLYRRGQRTGRMPLVWFWALLTFLAVSLALWPWMPAPPLVLSRPALGGRTFVGGKSLSPEYMAVLSGLVIYTAAFIADTVRAGIQAVSKGQREAATALGLTGMQSLRLVIFPQALRVIIPPLTSQYLNLTKNSSLAVAVGYPDLFSVGNTVLNQSGRAVEVVLITMLVYLSFSLLTSAFMNWYNRRTQFVER